MKKIMFINTMLAISDFLRGCFHKHNCKEYVKDIIHLPTTTNVYDVMAFGTKLGEIRKCKCGKEEWLYYERFIPKKKFVTFDDVG